MLPVGLHGQNIPAIHMQEITGKIQRLEPDSKQAGWKGRRLQLQQPTGALKELLEQVGVTAVPFPFPRAPLLVLLVATYTFLGRFAASLPFSIPAVLSGGATGSERLPDGRKPVDAGP